MSFPLSALVVAAAIVAWPAANVSGQIVRNAVGGISIDPDGVVMQPTHGERAALLAELRRDGTVVPEDLNGLAELRKISLRGLESAIEQALASGAKALPDELLYLGGIQRLRYVLLYPETGDIVLAGPGEGWKIGESGAVVGVTTGQPVALLDDLLVALRSANRARNGGISCSIDPTEQGRRQLDALLDRQRNSRTPVNPSALTPAVKRAFGPQQITLTGVANDTHFARVLVAADYRMKRLAMNLDRSPIRELPSYLQLIRGGRGAAANANPRWWLACDYQPLAQSEDELAWELRGPGVKTLTEDEIVTASGEVRGTGRSSEPAQRWAEMMTQHYDALAVADPVFGQLRNLMDMCVIAALIERHDLLSKAGCSLPILTGASAKLPTAVWRSPKTVAPECSFLRINNGWLITASGGVLIDSWSIASRTEPSDSVKQIRAESAAPSSSAWRWN